MVTVGGNEPGPWYYIHCWLGLSDLGLTLFSVLHFVHFYV